ncbi:hypothetical protein [Rhodococcoides fascians]|uniref:hypothetical protein n=1 Tax=Rhodococcoides fascians TaxID=1828 RepID=UPI003799C243
MIVEVVTADGEIVTYDHEGDGFTVDNGHLYISRELTNSFRAYNVAVHAADTWLIARKVTA